MDVEGCVATMATVLILLALNLDAINAEETAQFKDSMDASLVTVIAVCCISVLVVVFIISLCGGCTPMEVGSDDHAAASGRKSYQYDSIARESVVTDVNTRVMSSGTTLPNDPYQPTGQASMPYPLHPETAQTFTGYQTQQQQQQQPSVGSPGYGVHQAYQPPGANRHFSESEPPPPNYNEAIQSGTPGGQGHPGTHATAPTQPYGW